MDCQIEDQFGTARVRDASVMTAAFRQVNWPGCRLEFWPRVMWLAVEKCGEFGAEWWPGVVRDGCGAWLDAEGEGEAAHGVECCSDAPGPDDAIEPCRGEISSGGGDCGTQAWFEWC